MTAQNSGQALDIIITESGYSVPELERGVGLAGHKVAIPVRMIIFAEGYRLK